MHLTDLRFIQKTQELLLQFESGSQGAIQLGDLNPLAKTITGIEPISSTQIKLYFDGLESGQLFEAQQLQELMR